MAPLATTTTALLAASTVTGIGAKDIFDILWAVLGDVDDEARQEVVDAIETKQRRLQQSIRTQTLLADWDDRTLESRIVLFRRNPNWLREDNAERNRPMKLDRANPNAHDAEAACHGGRVLNFMDDVARAIKDGSVDERVLYDEFAATFRVWRARLAPVERFAESGWGHVPELLERWKEQAEREAPVVEEETQTA